MMGAMGGDSPQGIVHYEQAVQTSKQGGDLRAQARSLVELARLQSKLRNRPAATKCWEEALNIRRLYGDQSAVKTCLTELCTLHEQIDDFGLTVELAHELREVAAATRDGEREAVAWSMIARGEAGSGNLGQAEEALVNCIAKCGEIEGSEVADLLTADSHDKLGQLLRVQGRHEEADREEAEAQRVKRQAGLNVVSEKEVKINGERPHRSA
uniref:ER membrane protein complex subunit 2 n=1 Tax=Hemiselmis tepida TaxID=464990 RepID=A0A7S0WDW3_9CRYP